MEEGLIISLMLFVCVLALLTIYLYKHEKDILSEESFGSMEFSAISTDKETNTTIIPVSTGKTLISVPKTTTHYITILKNKENLHKVDFYDVYEYTKTNKTISLEMKKHDEMIYFTFNNSVLTLDTINVK